MQHNTQMVLLLFLGTHPGHRIMFNQHVKAAHLNSQSVKHMLAGQILNLYKESITTIDLLSNLEHFEIEPSMSVAYSFKHGPQLVISLIQSILDILMILLMEILLIILIILRYTVLRV